MTPQRQMVLDAVCEIGDHATPEEVYDLVNERTTAVNRATVYRSLKLLGELDLIRQTILPEGQVKYEIAGKRSHHHLVCRHCGRNIDITDDDIQDLAKTLLRKFDFKLESKHLTLTGLCAKCQE
jgi:Fur family ferric uptake transcriptional regulator